jgi:hypothetical protein
MSAVAAGTHLRPDAERTHCLATTGTSAPIGPSPTGRRLVPRTSRPACVHRVDDAAQRNRLARGTTGRLFALTLVSGVSLLAAVVAGSDKSPARQFRIGLLTAAALAPCIGWVVLASLPVSGHIVCG